MSLAAVLVGVARAIFVVLQDGRIVDTIVHGLFTPIEDLPRAFAGIAMMAAHGTASRRAERERTSGVDDAHHGAAGRPAWHVAANRRAGVSAGAGTTDMITPTNGALMAVLRAAGVRYDEWFRFAAPWFALLAGLGAVGLVVALAIGLQ